jgi:hypothetical protein
MSDNTKAFSYTPFPFFETCQRIYENSGEEQILKSGNQLHDPVADNFALDLCAGRADSAWLEHVWTARRGIRNSE